MRIELCAYMPHICRIFRQNAAYFTAFLAGELPGYFPKKSRYKPVSLYDIYLHCRATAADITAERGAWRGCGVVWHLPALQGDSRWHDGWARCLAGVVVWHHGDCCCFHFLLNPTMFAEQAKMSSDSTFDYWRYINIWLTLTLIDIHLGTRKWQTDGRTDRQTDKAHNAEH